MRTLSILLLSLALTIPALPVGAAFEGPGAQQHAAGGHASINQASQVAGAMDDTRCVLEGNIVEKTGRNKYLFEDASGKITVEISPKAFGPETVTPQTKVRIFGEVDTKKNRPNEVEARHLELIK